MKRTITTLFSKREERGRDLARRAAAAALALTLLWTGAVGVAASAAEPAPAAPAVQPAAGLSSDEEEWDPFSDT